MLEIDAEAAATNCIAQPDPMSGGSAIIQTISIYSNNGQLLEQLEDVNTWTAMYYHYSKTQGLENMRTLMEGVSPMVGTGLTSQYFTFDPVEGTTFQTCRVCHPFVYEWSSRTRTEASSCCRTRWSPNSYSISKERESLKSLHCYRLQCGRS